MRARANITVGAHPFRRMMPEFGVSPSPGPLPPSLTLDDSSGLDDWAATFTQGGSAVALADVDTVITDPSEDGIDQLVVTGSGIVDGADEVITIGADAFPANADKSTTEVVGSTTFAIAYVASTKKWTITKDGGGPAPKADLESLIEAMDYENTSGSPTTGDRTFTFVLTDESQNSNSAVSTITVEEAVVTAPNLTSPGTQYGAQGETIENIIIGNSGSAATFAIAGDSPTSLAEIEALGLSFNTSSGTISGTLDGAATVDTHSIKVEATNAAGSDDVTFDLVVTAGVTVTLGTTSFNWVQDDYELSLMPDVGLSSPSGVLASATLTLADTGASPGFDDGDNELLAVGRRLIELGTTTTTQAWSRGWLFDLSYNATTGVLTITPAGLADAPVAAFQALMRTTKFNRFGAGLTPGARTIDVKVNNGTGDSNEPTITLTEQVRLDIKVVDYQHNPISGATVTLKDPLAATVATDTTDVNGEVQFQFTENGDDYVLEVSAAGKQSIACTWTIDGSQHLCAPLFTNLVTMDAAWLADTDNLVDPLDSNSPYKLGTTDTLYQCDQNVTTPHIAFSFWADGVGLDINGYTVTYGNESAIGLTNEGFETGDFTGWDTTGASSATIESAYHTGSTGPYLFGSYCCKFTDVETSETIVSDPIAIPEADRLYSAMVQTSGFRTTGQDQITISVYDDVTEALLASDQRPGGQKHPNVTFVPTTTNNIRVEVTVEHVDPLDEHPPSTGYIDDVRVRHAGVCGVLMGYTVSGVSNGWTGQFASSNVCNTAYLYNSKTTGGIVQGQGNSAWSEAVYTQASPTARVIHNVGLTYDSDNGHGIQANYHAGETYITSCTLTGGGYDQHLWNRASHFAGLKFGSGDHDLSYYIEGNTTADMCQQSIAILDPRTEGIPRFVRNNRMNTKTKYTNAYSILLNSTDHATIAYNTTDLPDGYSGRGLLVDAAGGRGCRYLKIHGNDMAIRERPNPEYSYDGLEAAAFRIRSYAEDPAKDPGTTWHGYCDINYNRFFAYTDANLVTEAAGLKSNFVGNEPDIAVDMSDNIFRAIVNTTNTNYIAYAMNVGDSINNETAPITLRGNMADSNDIGIKFLGGDAGNPCHDVFFYDTEIRKSTAGAARSYKSVYADGSPTSIRIWDTYLLDTVGVNGAAASDITFTGANNPKNIDVGWTADVLVNGGAGATVTADDSAATEVFSGTADGSGMVEGVVLIQTRYEQAGTNPATITETDYNNHDFTCIKAGETNGTAEVTADRPRYFEMDFNTAYTPPSLNDPGTQTNDLGDTGVSLTLTNSGSAYDYTEVTTGPLPDDLTLSGLTISGNINAGETPGTFPLVISAVNAYGSGSSSFDWEIASGITVPTYTVETAETSVNSSSLAINTPAGGSTGQRMYAMIISAPRAMATPSGWILEDSQAHTIGGYFLYIYSRDGDHQGGSEPASHTFSTTGLTGSIAGAIFTIDGDADPATTAPAIVVQEEGYGGPWHSPAVTVPANSSLSICFGGVNSNTLTDLTQNSHTSIAQLESNGAANLALMWREDSAGARAELSWTQTSANYRLEGIISIPPA